MGTVCPCGVKVNARSENNRVSFEKVPYMVCGNLHYTADVCVASPGASTLSLVFTDSHPKGKFNFTFHATAFTSITCEGNNNRCHISIRGEGVVNGATYPFHAIFSDLPSGEKADIVTEFEIIGFFDQLGPAYVKQGSVVALGCM